MIIIKIGGGATINHEAIVSDLVHLTEPYLIVHGANATRDKLAASLGKSVKTLTSVSGYSSVYSDQEAIDLLMMAYSGLANKRLVSLCQAKGINAIGLSGVDGRTIVGKRNAGIRVQEGDKQRIIRDYSGKPVSVNKALLEMLISKGYVPVLCVPIIDDEGTPLNSENDDIVQLLQVSLRAAQVIHFIEAPGLLADPSKEDSVVATLNAGRLAENLANAKGRMKRKLLSIQKLLEGGCPRVVIADGRVQEPIQRAVQGKGTVIS